MRLIGHLNSEANARTFGDYLTSAGMRNLIESESDGTWAIWIHNEDQIPAGQAAFAQYQSNPSDAAFQRARQSAAALQQKQRADESAVQKRMFDRHAIWPQMSMGPLTLILIVVSVIVTLAFVLTPLLRGDLHWLEISEYMPAAMLPEVRQGQLWRLITPIFIHFSIIHILFNMIMLRDLGSIIEIRQGTGKLALMVVILGVTSNLGQFFMAGPGFGGFSGVLYGLFGYIWIRGRVDPHSGLFMSSSSVTMMLVWFVLCWGGLVGAIANGTHTVGLLVGVAWGALPMIMPGRA